MVYQVEQIKQRYDQQTIIKEHIDFAISFGTWFIRLGIMHNEIDQVTHEIHQLDMHHPRTIISHVAIAHIM